MLMAMLPLPAPPLTPLSVTVIVLGVGHAGEIHRERIRPAAGRAFETEPVPAVTEAPLAVTAEAKVTTT